MKITVRFEPGEEVESWAEVFLNALIGRKDLGGGLGLSSFKWQEDQEFEIASETTINVFHNRLRIPEWLSVDKSWRCSLRRGKGSLLFLINDRPVGALMKHSLMRGEADPEHVLSMLPISIQVLSILGLDWKLLPDLSIFEELTTLNLNSCEDLSDISGMKDCINLKGLNLSWCEFLSDITPVRGLVLLDHLNLGCCRSLTNLSSLSELAALRYLDLSGDELAGTKKTDLSPLSNLRKLETLNLVGNKSLSDLAPLSELASLKFLDLKNARSVSDISPLGRLSSLENLGSSLF